MIKARVHRPIQLLGVAAFVVWALPAANAQVAIPRGPSEPQAPLSLETINQTSTSTAGTAGQKATHTVRRGETLYSIARRYGTSVASLKAWNGLQGNSIRVGRRLTVYASGATATQARRSTRTRTRTSRRAAAALALREAQEPRFKLDENGVTVPDLRAEAAIIYSPETGKVLWEENAQDQRSIASITKIMTAAVFLEDDPDLTREVVIQRADVLRASTTYLRAGYKVTNSDLLHLLLIASDNAAARALARISPYGSQGFIVRMNEKAAELGLTNTHYSDPSGLLSDNVSTAYDMARLITHVASDQRIARDHAEATSLGACRPAHHQHPQHESARHERRRRRARRQDRIHPESGLLPGDAAASAAGWATGRGRRAGRPLQRRPILGDAPPVQLAGEQGPGSLRRNARRSRGREPVSPNNRAAWPPHRAAE